MKSLTVEQQKIVYEALGKAFQEIVNDPRMKDAEREAFAHAWLSMGVYNLNVCGIQARRILSAVVLTCDSPELIGRAMAHEATAGTATFEEARKAP